MYHHLGCTSIYRLLSYPLIREYIRLILPVGCVTDKWGLISHFIKQGLYLTERLGSGNKGNVSKIFNS